MLTQLSKMNDGLSQEINPINFLGKKIKSIEIVRHKGKTILYLRLSREDALDGESNSIATQRTLLLNFARQHGFENIEIIIDDGVSGVTFDRPGFKKMLGLIESGQVSTVIVKDMSRLGRNYIEVGYLTETVFPLYNVRFIAVNDGVDSNKGEDDFTPFRNIMNEWYAKDMSRKVKSALKIKNNQGYAIGRPPIGYIYDETNKKRWIIDEEGAEIVRYIFKLRQQNKSIYTIAKILKNQKIYTPSVYAAKKGINKPVSKKTLNEYQWDPGVVKNILTNQSYVGDVVNFKTYRKSFKLKRKMENARENWQIHKNVHEPIISGDLFEQIQKSFCNTKCRKPKHTEKNMFSGLLKCSDCGANLNYNYTSKNPLNHCFICRNNRIGNGLCEKTHHIRVDVLTSLVQNDLSNVVQFATKFEDEFIKIVAGENKKQFQSMQKKNIETLNKMLARDKELDILCEKVFEEKVLGNLSEDRFLRLCKKYEQEQLDLKVQIKSMKEIVEEEKKNELNAEAFLKIVKAYSKINELSVDILHAFIDKIIVHHREEICGEKVQKIEIYYKMIGKVQIPKLNNSKEDDHKKGFEKTKKE